jgi:hypothetical protein
MQETPLVIREMQAARLLNVSVAALRKWRHEGRGPAFVKLERCIGYRLADIETFLSQNLHQTQATKRRGAK